MSNPQPYNLTRGSITLVIEGLQHAGWSTSPVELYRGAKLAVELEAQFEADTLPEATPSETKQTYQVKVKEWANRKIVLPLKAKDVKVLKTCMAYLVQERRILPSIHYITLAEAIGLISDDDIDKDDE